MNWRGGLRRAIPYVVAIFGGFLLAYLIVAFFIFPSGVVPKDVKVPNVIGLMYDDAAQRIRQAGFEPEQGEATFHEMAPKGTVLDQSPAAGAKDLAGSKVTLTVSAGQKMATVPTVAGMGLDQAEKAITDAGYVVGDVNDEPSNDPRGTVIGTRPAAGTSLPAQNSLTLLVSAGPTVLSAPDVVGRSYADAVLLLRQAGVEVGSVTTDTGEPPQGTMLVMSQTPAGGSQVGRGTHIDLRLGAP